MVIETLISTMNQKDSVFLDKMNLRGKTTVINQTNDSTIIGSISKNVSWVNSETIGLSCSRNIAIKKSDSDICIIADDDLVYNDNYHQTILNAYEHNPRADIIAFIVRRTNTDTPKTFRMKSGWQNYLSAMKISSVEITFKRKSILENNITFNEKIGAGSKYYLGEENVFLTECLKKGLKIKYIPIEIGTVDASESSWFEGYTRKYFKSLGAVYYCMSEYFYIFLIIQFAIRKKQKYSGSMNLIQAVKAMLEGKRQYKNEYK